MFSVAVHHWVRSLLCGAIKRIGLEWNLTLPYLLLLDVYHSHLLHFSLAAPARFAHLQDAKLRHRCAVELVKRICVQISKKDISWRLNYLLTSEILNTATVNGIIEIIRTLLEYFPDLIWVRLSNNQFLLLPFAIELRHENLFRILCDKTAKNKLMASTLLESGTILHLAAKLAPLPQLSSISGAALQMQRELQWFKVFIQKIYQLVIGSVPARI